MRVRDPAGQTLLLSHDTYRAEVVTVGAGLRTLTHDGVDLVAGYPAGTMCPQFRGWVLMPWPNRVGDGAYEFAGASLQLPLSEVARGNALHGLVGFVPWTVASYDESRTTLRYEMPPQTGYPFSLDLTVTYELGPDGLRVTLAAHNVGDGPAPYGTGHHPYFTLGRPVDDLVLTVPATTYCPMDDRGLPSAAEPVAGTPYDFRTPRAVGDTVLDHPLGGLTDSVVSVVDPQSGRGIELTLGDGFDWVHLFSCDPHDPPRQALAIEPMTCPPDAFRTGVDLLVLQPGETHEVSFTVAATGS
ncbi:aldose 1-epimerase [Nocardioides sp. PD653]|nr:aldose 1-epimerase [Nocardioides sp. PD653-B2]GAW52664.1 aldose 1-epimerase [Nocardioides sp. PD653]